MIYVDNMIATFSAAHSIRVRKILRWGQRTVSLSEIYTEISIKIVWTIICNAWLRLYPENIYPVRMTPDYKEIQAFPFLVRNSGLIYNSGCLHVAASGSSK